MFKSETFEYEVWGSKALFTEPITRIGGEKSSYHIPTVEAIKGITRNIYWKPSIIWHIDEIRVMNKISTFKVGIKTIDDKLSPDLHLYMYLANVHYKVRAHFEWNNVLTEHTDRNHGKHSDIMRRFIARGGKMPVFLGTSECHAYVGPTSFLDGKSYYDDYGEYGIGRMFKNYEYPTEHKDKNLYQVSWSPTMYNGIIKCNNDSDIKRLVGPISFSIPPNKNVPECMEE